MRGWRFVVGCWVVACLSGLAILIMFLDWVLIGLTVAIGSILLMFLSVGMVVGKRRVVCRCRSMGSRLKHLVLR